jgi:hypothetical protein
MRVARGLAVLVVFAATACGQARTARIFDGPVLPPVVTLTANGAEPLQLHLYTQEGVTFVNQDSRSREVRFDAARSTDSGCAAIAVGRIEAGQQRTTPLLPGFALCYYGVADAPQDARFQGVVVTH